MKIFRCLLIFLSALIIAWPMIAISAVVQLPKTGQITCYDELGNIIDCAGTGQDGDVQAGIAWPEPRFEDNSDGTITDHLTGLIWLKNANCAGKIPWSDAVAYSNNLSSGACGLSDGSAAGDWRLPNFLELENLFNAESLDFVNWLFENHHITIWISSEQSTVYFDGLIEIKQRKADRNSIADCNVPAS